MIEIKKPTGNKKLADTLKRCGIASSVHDALRMAKDITSTEKKVQNFFDKKKVEIKKEFINKVHKNTEKDIETKRNMEKPKISVNYIKDNFKKMLKTVENPEPVKIQVDFDTPKFENTNKEIKDDNSSIEIKKISSAEEKEDNILKSKKTLNKLMENNKEDYINKYINNKEQDMKDIETKEIHTDKKQEIIQTPQNENVETHQPKQEDSINKINLKNKKDEEFSVDINDYFNFAKKNRSQKQKMQKIENPVKTGNINHPKTGNSIDVNLDDYFNFAKRGKI